MLRMNIELVPMGVEANKRTLGQMTIANVGGTAERGEYVVSFTTSVKCDGVQSAYGCSIYEWDRRKSASLLVAHAFHMIAPWLQHQFDLECGRSHAYL